MQLMELAILNGTYRDANIKQRKDNTATLLEKKSFKRVLWLSPKENPFWFQVEPPVERVLPGTQKGSIWNPKGFFMEPKMVLHGTQNGSTWNQKLFFKWFSYGDSRRILLGSR